MAYSLASSLIYPIKGNIIGIKKAVKNDRHKKYCSNFLFAVMALTIGTVIYKPIIIFKNQKWNGPLIILPNMKRIPLSSPA